ncbi:hypothetical protein [Actinacidiphila paucisporea]|uniref:Uncharacterized protein n=1 Tax=Actinacidiphila paucisporea TaxID=310782 RepID=A0A1M7DZJ4_9ACTN|nr:hypothetical protein [Actinacidiphila paucisporea]SHL84912.1 hypothetical protein SAMN05216499_106236 [Actinacidiphila paucisporea]
MGLSVLYIAFGIVALWLLGEVLLQYKARLRWRVLAFCGFLGVVVGVAVGQIAVIVLGALAFGAGQTLVTLSYKRGFSTGWALGGQPGSSRRRKGGAPRTEPVIEVGPVEEDDFAAVGSGPGADHAVAAEQIADPAAGAADDVYQPVPLHEDSGEYPLYGNQQPYPADPYTDGGYEGYGTQGYQDWGTGPQPAAASYGYQNGQNGQHGQGSQHGGYGDSSGWAGDQAAAASYGGQQQDYGYDQGGYQQPAAGYDYVQTTGDWTGQPQSPADPYGYGYQQEQPPTYIPHQQGTYESDPQQNHQQHQQPYEQQSYDQQTYEQQQQQPQYADPYDPYRY